MKTLFLMITLLISYSSIGQSFLEGQIIDQESIEALIGANLVIYQNDRFITGTSTDTDGMFSITLDPGTYDIQVSYIGYPEKILEDVLIDQNSETLIDIELLAGVAMEEVVIVEYNVPLIWTCCSCGCRMISSTTEPKKQKKELANTLSQALHIYPNPTVDQVFIKLSEDIDHINLISVTGRTLKKVNQPKTGTTQMDLSHLPAGTYFIQIQKGSDFFTKRLIITKP